MTIHPNAHTPSRAHLLLIEDASVLRELEVLALTAGGFSVTALEHPGDALRHLQTAAVDAVVVNTERATALQPNFIAALRHSKAGVRILVLQGDAHPGEALDLEAHGANLVIDRPLHPSQLLVRVDAFLGPGLLPAAPKAADDVGSPRARSVPEPALA